MARRLRVYVSGISAGPSELPREQAHYVGSVHRLGVGASFVAFDPELGIEWPVESPLLSPKDTAAPTLRELVAQGRLPVFRP